MNDMTEDIPTKPIVEATQGACSDENRMPGSVEEIAPQPACLPSVAKLFVGSLPYEVTEDDLLSIFNKFGEIVEFSILRDRFGKSRGCAALTYTTHESAELCIKTLHNRFCCGNVTSPLQVRYFEKRESFPVMCYLEGLPYCFTPAVLWTSISTSYGPVANVFLDAMNPFAAYISFYKKSSAYHLSSDSRNGCVCVGGVLCPGVGVTIIKNPSPMPQPVLPTYAFYPSPQFGFSIPPPAIQMTSPAIEPLAAPEEYSDDAPMKLFVGCLPYSKTAQDIADLFSPFGTLIEVAILTDYAGKSRGAAFVTFSKTSHAKRAVEELKDFSFPKSTRSINISFAYKQTVWSHPPRLPETSSGHSCNGSTTDEHSSPLSNSNETKRMDSMESAGLVLSM